MKTRIVDVAVTITSVRFTDGIHGLPTRMEWQGRTVRFCDSGIRVRGRLGHTITLSDDRAHYCLRHQHGVWRLLSVSS